MQMWNVGWSLGVYCNARCNHCYSWRMRQSGNSLTVSEINLILGKLAGLGVRTLNLGGNEPIFTNGPEIAKSTLPHVVRGALERGIEVGITTNSTTCLYLYREHFDVWNKVNDWDLSIDSPFESEHDHNRGAKLFNHVLRAAELCTAHGKPKSFIMPAMNWNTTRRHLDELLDLARRHDAEVRVNTLKPLEERHFSLLPAAEQVYEVFHYLLDNCDTAVMAESVFAPLCAMTAPKGCPCGSESFRINPKTIDGRVPVTPCVYLHDHLTGDLLKDQAEDIVMAESFLSLRRRREAPLPFCREVGCQSWEVCRGGCATRAYLISGSMDEPDPYCPVLLSQRGLVLPSFPTVEARHDGLRVHENYLCTWIGRPRTPAAPAGRVAGMGVRGDP